MAERKSKLGLFIALFIFLLILFVTAFFLLNKLVPDWKDKIPKNIITINKNTTQNIDNSTTENIYPNAWGFGKTLAYILIPLIIILGIIVIMFIITRKGKVDYQYTLDQCRDIMFDKLKNSKNSNIRFQDGVGTWGIPFSIFMKDDSKFQWAACVYSMVKLNENVPFNPYFCVAAICSMNDPKNKFFPFFGWRDKDLIEKLHIISKQTPWARIDAVKVDFNLPLDLPDFQQGIKQGIQEKGKEVVTGVA